MAICCAVQGLRKGGPVAQCVPWYCSQHLHLSFCLISRVTRLLTPGSGQQASADLPTSWGGQPCRSAAAWCGEPPEVLVATSPRHSQQLSALPALPLTQGPWGRPRTYILTGHPGNFISHLHSAACHRRAEAPSSGNALGSLTLASDSRRRAILT